MTPRQRVSAVFEGRRPDRVSVHHIGASSGVASALLGREAYVGGGIQTWREAKARWEGPDAHAEFIERSYRDAIDLAKVLGNDVVRPMYWRCQERPTRKVDEYTYLFEHGDESNWRVFRYDAASEQLAREPLRPRAAQTMADLEAEIAVSETSAPNYQPTDEAFDFQLRALAEVGDEHVIRADGVGFGVPHDAIYFEALALRPDLIERYLDVQVTRVLRNVEFLSRAGFVYLFGGCDFASNAGPMYSPAVFRELMLPRLRAVSDACHERGAKHLFASDGNLWPVADALFAESGIDGYYEIDRRAGMDLGRLRDEFPELTLVGNISSHTLHRGSEEDVVGEARDCTETARRRGRVVVGVSNYIVPGTPMENVMAMLNEIEAAR